MAKCIVAFFILVLKSHWIYINSKSWEVYIHNLLVCVREGHWGKLSGFLDNLGIARIFELFQGKKKFASLW